MKKVFFLTSIMAFCVCVFVRAQDSVPTGITYRAANYTFILSGNLKGFKPVFSTRSDQKGIEYLVLRLNARSKQSPAPLTLHWSVPVVDIQGTWTTARNFNKYLDPNWANNAISSGATTQAPVTVLYNFNNRSKLTFACSDALNPIKITAGVNETTAMMDCEIKLFTQAQPDIDTYELTLRLDTRDLPYWETLNAVAKWWAAMPFYMASKSPETARLPMYSTWYSFHQKLETKAVEEQCRLAKAIGCETVIVDDGWQTLDSSRGYAFTGDWMPERIQDMKAHVARVHQLGMKFILWYSVPFVGEKSKIYPQFKGKYLYYSKGWGTYALDPRFPEVREYLIQKYVSALKDWDLDGFKLDFVDSFVTDETSTLPIADGKDYTSVNEAADKLLTDVMLRLRALKPDVMIEFRQSYIGPLMRKYGNMFRAGDSPNDALSNRVKIVDIRLLCDNTAAHSDMLMWNKAEKTEVAALQLLNVIFSVPQISVKLDEIPAAHREMLVFWLKFWKNNRDVLLDGAFMPEHPDMNYPLVTGITEQKQVTAVYAAKIAVEIKGKMREKLMIVNANYSNNIILHLTQPSGIRNIRVLDCLGKQISFKRMKLEQGVHVFDVPASGLLEITL